MSILKDYPPANEDGSCSTGMYLGCVDNGKLYYVCGTAEGRKSSNSSSACDIKNLMRDDEGYYPSCSSHPKTICKDQPSKPIINPENSNIDNNKKEDVNDKKDNIPDNHQLIKTENSFILFAKSTTGIILISVISIILFLLIISIIYHFGKK